MISFPLKKYRYKIFFYTHEIEFSCFTSPENMHHDFDSGEVVKIEFHNAVYFIDFSKVEMIRCTEEIDFKDLPKDTATIRPKEEK